MLHKIRQSIYNPICLSCGSYFVQPHLFCHHCYAEKIEPKLELKKNNLGLLQNTYSLFDWNPGESDLLSEMVYRFKSDCCPLAWWHYSQLAVKALSFEIDLSQIKYVAPIPGSKKSSVHAFVFAKMAAEILNRPVINLLEKSLNLRNQSEQKTKNKVQRSHSQFALREEFTQNLDYLKLHQNQVLLVDDIITTGSSYNQCLRLLGATQRPTLLTLFHRTIKTKGVLVS